MWSSSGRRGLIVRQPARNIRDIDEGDTPHVFSGALSGFTIAITADRRADEQAELVRRRGGEVIFGPVIRTLPLADEAALAEATAAVVMQPPDVVVLSTALGARSWFSGAEALGVSEPLHRALSCAEVLARGPKAAGAAVAAGLEVGWTTPSATSAEIVDRLAARSPMSPDRRRVRVAVQLDGARSPTLTSSLARLGYDVVPVPVYEWSLPEDLAPAERVVAAVCTAAVDAVTFTSAYAVSNFVEIAERIGRYGPVRDAIDSGVVAVVCVGPVTAARARALGFKRPIVPAVARLGAMVQALVGAFDDRGLVVDPGGLRLRVQGRFVSVDGGAPIRLPDREHAVLSVLARRPGAVVSKQSLLDEVWSGDGDEHVVEVTVGRLRRRLGLGGDSIETVVRRGYRLALG